MSKFILQVIYSCSLPKKRLKKHKIPEKWDHLENQPSCKAYSFCKIVNLSQKLNFQKTCQNLFYEWFTVVLCKKPLEETPNTREMRPFWKSAIMQSLCKLVTFGEKSKFQKSCQNPFCKWFRVLLCKKTARKNTQYSRNQTISKIGHQARPIAFAKSSFWVKN